MTNTRALGIVSAKTNEADRAKRQQYLLMAEKKRYQVKGTCPQCACGSIYHLTAEEIESKTIDRENIEFTCPECGLAHSEQVKSACPEFAQECHL